MGCSDSKPVVKPSKAANATSSKATETAVPGEAIIEEAGQASQAGQAVTDAFEAEAAEATEPEAKEAPDPVEAKPSTDFLEQEAELPVIPESNLGIKSEGLEDSETTLPKEEESPRLFGRLKVEAAPDVPRGPCLCTNLW